MAETSTVSTVTSNQATWSLNGSLATATLRNYRLEVDAANPQRGVQWSTERKHAFRGATLEFVVPQSAKGPMQLREVYVRGRDVVAAYDQLPGAEVQPQLNWRLLEHAELEAIGVELLISMQTSLLHSEPKCTVESVLPGVRTAAWPKTGQDWHHSADDPEFDVRFPPQATGGVTWFSAPKEYYSYVEVIYPDDLVSQHVTLGRSEACFFAEPLEKGVIRRGRIAGWIVPNTKLMTGPEAVFGLLELARREPLPLTT